MKAIHNGLATLKGFDFTVFNTSKIQNESNSQRNKVVNKERTYCVQYVKDTK